MLEHGNQTKLVNNAPEPIQADVDGPGSAQGELGGQCLR